MRFPLRHCANTGATACYPEMHLDMVRPGLLLYGYGEFAQGLDLRPVMTLKTTISTTKTYEPGTSVSYGRLFTTQRRTRMGVVPLRLCRRVLPVPVRPVQPDDRQGAPSGAASAWICP